ncbi:hypothetical protein ACQKMD_04150 [Viridibacillus sp. NPDC096237]|uniref:hypothetical protein n=1 Tax=Viridibacillus sp. NPDC096237 TaxID=3390721 RepID=UPI003CFD53D7
MNFKKRLVIALLLTSFIFTSEGVPGATAGERLEFSNNDIKLNPEKSTDLSPVKEGDAIASSSTIANQQINFRGEGFAGFTYRGGKSFEVSIANDGNDSFKWVIIAPDNSRFHSGTLQAGEKMKWIYPDFDAPNGSYGLYIYSSLGIKNPGLAKLFVKNIEL